MRPWTDLTGLAGDDAVDQVEAHEAPSPPSQTAAACATARPPECESETSMLADALRPGEGRRPPVQLDPGPAGTVAQDLDVGPAQALARAPVPIAFEHGLLGGEPRRQMLVRPGPPRAVLELAGREDLVLDAGVLPQEPRDAFHRQDVDADPDAGARRHHRLVARPCLRGSRP